jgi:alkanesulfonate monooxygenase SsuD/methylene tetrahydromethanopterin reductase-like flavin-dependent oxidoreductase (luciferase family)
MAAELCNGFFPVWMNPERYDIFGGAIEKGLAKAGGGKSLASFDVAPFVTVVLGDDLAQCRMPVKGMLALYIGGMGARDKNFYTAYATQLGYGAEAKRIQDLYLDGKKAEAMAAVPDALVDDIALVGPKDRIRDRAQRWIEAGKKKHVGSMLLGSGQKEALQLMAELVL